MNGWLFLWALPGLLAALLLIAAVRAARMKPQAAAGEAETPQNPARYAQSLSEMIRVETVSSYENTDFSKFYAFQALLGRLYPRVSAALEKTDFNGSVLYRWKGAGGAEPIVLMAHMDVVEPGAGWTKEPFSGEIAGGRVWGRGAVDTKCSLCAILEAAEELLAEGFAPDRDIYLAFACDEEISGPGAPAIASYLKERGVRPGLVLDEGGIVMESPVPGIRGRYALIGVAEKGYADVKFIANGKGGHASTPPRGTPVARLACLIARLETHSPFGTRLSKPLKEMFAAMAPQMTFGMRFVMGNLWLFGPLVALLLPKISLEGAAMLRTTCVFTVTEGAKSTNVIPQRATAVANLRFMPFQNMAESLALLKKIAARFDVETELICGNAATPATDVHGEGFQKLLAVTRDCFPGVGTGPYVVLGGTDSRHYAGFCPNVLRFSPMFVDDQQYRSIHSADENLSVDSLAAGVVFFKKLVRSFAG